MTGYLLFLVSSFVDARDANISFRMMQKYLVERRRKLELL